MSWREAMKQAALEVFTVILVVSAFALIVVICAAPLVLIFHLAGTTVGVVATVVGTVLSLFFFSTWVIHRDPRK